MKKNISNEDTIFCSLDPQVRKEILEGAVTPIEECIPENEVNWDDEDASFCVTLIAEYEADEDKGECITCEEMLEACGAHLLQGESSISGFLADAQKKICEAEQEVGRGEGISAEEALNKIKGKYGM